MDSQKHIALKTLCWNTKNTFRTRALSPRPDSRASSWIGSCPCSTARPARPGRSSAARLTGVPMDPPGLGAHGPTRGRLLVLVLAVRPDSPGPTRPARALSPHGPTRGRLLGLVLVLVVTARPGPRRSTARLARISNGRCGIIASL